jgi:hypothetical protein
MPATDRMLLFFLRTCQEDSWFTRTLGRPVAVDRNRIGGGIFAVALLLRPPYTKSRLYAALISSLLNRCQIPHYLKRGMWHLEL